MFLLAVYRSVGTTHLGGQCRFHPSCSQYAVEAVTEKPLLNALSLIAKRLARCHPWGGFGEDPLPRNEAHAK